MNSTMIIGRIEEKEEAPNFNWVRWKILVAVNDEYSGKPICRLWCSGNENLEVLKIGDWIVANGKLRDDWNKGQPGLQIRCIQKIEGTVSALDADTPVNAVNSNTSIPDGPKSLGEILSESRSEKPR